MAYDLNYKNIVEGSKVPRMAYNLCAIHINKMQSYTIDGEQLTLPPN